jgi:CheY-like chemotaxis protein
MLTKCCLFIDENLRHREIFSEALEYISPNTNCFTASSGTEALHLMVIENVLPAFILIELNLPRMGAKHFLRKIREHEVLRDVPVIVHCTSPLPTEILELKELGAHAIYFRPYDFNGVCNILTLYFTNQMAGILPN